MARGKSPQEREKRCVQKRVCLREVERQYKRKPMKAEKRQRVLCAETLCANEIQMCTEREVQRHSVCEMQKVGEK